VALSTNSEARIPLDVLDGKKKLQLLAFGASIGALCKVVLDRY
jgi:hypothetical protein